MADLRRALKKIFGPKSVSTPTAAEANIWGRQLVDEAWKNDPNIEKMQKLILQGANVNITNADNASILLTVAGRQSFSNENALKLCKMLVAAGADVNTKTESGNTAIIWALRLRRTELACFLVKQGADIYAENSKDETGLSLAQKFDDKDVLKAIQEMSSPRNSGPTP